MCCRVERQRAGCSFPGGAKNRSDSVWALSVWIRVQPWWSHPHFGVRVESTLFLEAELFWNTRKLAAGLGLLFRLAGLGAALAAGGEDGAREHAHGEEGEIHEGGRLVDGFPQQRRQRERDVAAK